MGLSRCPVLLSAKRFAPILAIQERAVIISLQFVGRAPNDLEGNNRLASFPAPVELAIFESSPTIVLDSRQPTQH